MDKNWHQKGILSEMQKQTNKQNALFCNFIVLWNTQIFERDIFEIVS